MEFPLSFMAFFLVLMEFCLFLMQFRLFFMDCCLIVDGILPISGESLPIFSRIFFLFLDCGLRMVDKQGEARRNNKQQKKHQSKEKQPQQIQDIA